MHTRTNLLSPPAARAGARTLTLRWWLVLVLIPFAWSCERRDELKDLSSAVEQFHESYNAEKFDGIYRTASSAYRRQVTRSANARLFHELFLQYGVVDSSDRADFLVQRSGGSTLISARYSTRFAQGSATEYFGFRYAPGGSRLELLIYRREP